MPTRAHLAKIFSVFALAAMLVAGASAAALAQDRQPQAQKQADAPETFEALLTKAQAGDPSAQCKVGVAYLNGQSVAQDYRQGLSWLMHASDAGFGYARYVLADVSSRGFAGVPVDDARAYYYASLAAASSALSDQYRERAVKLRDASAKRLTTAQVAGLQAKAALAPLDAAGAN